MLDLALETSHQIIPIGISIEIRVLVSLWAGPRSGQSGWENSVEIKTLRFYKANLILSCTISRIGSGYCSNDHEGGEGVLMTASVVGCFLFVCFFSYSGGLIPSLLLKSTVPGLEIWLRS